MGSSQQHSKFEFSQLHIEQKVACHEESLGTYSMFRKLTYDQLLFIIITISFLLRIALVSFVAPYPERYIQADGIGYNQLAVNLVSGHGFSTEVSPPFTPNNFRTPIYPLTIALFYFLFGYHSELILWLQVLMGTITVALTFFLAKLFGGPKVGLIAALLISISPHSITYSALLWSDTEYTLVFVFSILLISLMLINNNIKWGLWGGLVSGIAVLIHPRSLYLPLLIGIFLSAVMLRKKAPLTHFLKILGVYLLIFNLVILPWRIRNYVEFGIPNISSAGGVNMLHYGAALVESRITGEDQWSIAAKYDSEVRQMLLEPNNEAKYGDLALKIGIKKILQNPITYIRVHIIGMLKIFLPGTSQINTILTGQNALDTSQIYALFINNQDVRSIFQPLFGYSLLALGYIGFESLYLSFIYLFSLFTIIKQKGSVLLWFFLLVLLYLTLVAGPAGAPRFRVVMMPLFSILAADGLLSANFLSKRHNYRLDTFRKSEKHELETIYEDKKQ